MFFLKPGDTIEFIAPASKFYPKILKHLPLLMKSWSLEAKISCPMSKDEWLCAANVKERFTALQDALLNPISKALWVVQGGYGCSQILPFLDQMPKPSSFKLLMGFSDTTILHIFVNKKWNWPSLHCAAAGQLVANKVCRKSVSSLQDFIFGNLPYRLELSPMNNHVKQLASHFSIKVTGGNLSLVISSLATPWQIQAEDRFLFLEETSEAAYRIDRMFYQLLQAGILNKIKGLILGEFIQKESKAADDQTKRLLQEWAQKLSIPVFSCKTGHAKHNYPIPLNCLAQFYSSDVPHLLF